MTETQIRNLQYAKFLLRNLKEFVNVKAALEKINEVLEEENDDARKDNEHYVFE